MTTRECPDPSTLQKLAERGGTEADIDSLARHLEQCDDCGQVMDTLLGTDETHADLCSGKSIDMPSGPVLENLKARLRGLKTIAAVACDQTNTLLVLGAELPTTKSSPAVTDATEAYASFLAPPEQPDEVGRLGGYRILRKLGAGGMGIVFLADDIQLRRQVALKTLMPTIASHREAKERFLREARAMASVEHEHIIAIHQVGEDRGIPFIAMPFLKGEALDVRMRRGLLPIHEAVRIVTEMAEGLAVAHDHGLIHRDVKPGNVWLEGNHARVKLLDFGLARAELEDLQLTNSGAIIGTPAFMAPEQARGEDVDGRADIFSLGAVLYTMLTGKRPFDGASTMTILTALALKDPPEPRSINSDVPASLSDLTMRLLAKERDRRPLNARLVADQLREALQERGHNSKISDMPKVAATSAPRSQKNRSPLYILLAALAGISLAAAVIVIRLPTKDGELILEADSEQIEVKISQPKADPVIIVIDKNSKRTVEIKTGNGVLEARELPDGLRFKAQTFDLTSEKRKVLTATMLLAAKERGAPVPVARTESPEETPIQPDLTTPAPDYVETPEFIAWKQNIAALDPEKQVAEVTKRLRELNPGYDGREVHRIEDGKVTHLHVSTDKVFDISPVRALTDLQTLNLGSSNPLSGGVVDLTPLSELKIWELNLIGNRVSDLSPLKKMKLTSLNCSFTHVSSLAPIAGMPLERLECDDAPIEDFSPLRTVRLRFITLASVRPDRLPAAIPVLREIKTLELIDQRPAQDIFRDLDGLVELQSALTQLKEVNPKFDGICRRHVIVRGHITELTLASRELRDLSPLQMLPKLAVLELGLGNYWDLSDLSGLKGLSLTSLGVNGASVVDLTPLEGMPLKYLDLHHTKVRDLTPLRGMPLKFLNCEETPVTDLAPLVGTPLEEFRWTYSIPAESIPGLKALQTIKTLKVVNGKPKDAIESQIAGVITLVPVLEELQKVNPQYTGKVRWFTVTQGKVTAVSIAPPGEFRHLAPLAALTDLKHLDLDSSNSHWDMHDLSELKGLQLERLGLRGALVTDLTPLEGMPLKSLNLTYTKVTDLTPLSKTSLIEIELFYDPLRDSSALKLIKTLEKINNQPAAEVLK